MFLAANDEIQNQKLKVQEVMVRKADVQLYATTGSHSVILVKEPVSAVVSCELLDDSASAIVLVQASALSIVDSAAYTAGGDKGGILINNIQMATSDIFRVCYISVN